ncbi:MAG: hypothetical protein WC869_05015 [Phycisphaerae bacterium]|jgi:hypothetical protein
MRSIVVVAIGCLAFQFVQASANAAASDWFALPRQLAAITVGEPATAPATLPASAPATAPATLPAIAPAAAPSSQPAAEVLRIDVVAERDAYRLNEPIQVLVRLRNEGNEPITIMDYDHGPLPGLELKIDGPSVETRDWTQPGPSGLMAKTIPPKGTLNTYAGIGSAYGGVSLRQQGQYAVTAIYRGWRAQPTLAPTTMAASAPTTMAASAPAAPVIWSGQIGSNTITIIVQPSVVGEAVKQSQGQGSPLPTGNAPVR